MTEVSKNPYVIRDGQKIPVKKANGHYCYQYNGKTYYVTRLNTIFGLNNSTAQQQATMHKNWYKYCVEKIALLKEEAVQIAQDLKESKKNYEQYLCSLGVDSSREITNECERTQARKYESKIYTNKSAKRMNSAQTIYYANRGASEAYQEGHYRQQVTVEQYTQQNFYA